MNGTVPNFTVVESVYGKFIINRHCEYQAEQLIKTGRTHIEDELTAILKLISTIPDRPMVVDAGANAGLVAIPVAQAIKAKGGIVHAFEVQRPLFYALCGSAALNDLNGLFVHNQALGAAPGTLKVPALDYGKPQDFGLCSLVDQQGAEAGEQVSVTTIDSLGLPGLDFLKIDVEGMEIEVLTGAAKSLAAFRPWCWVEYWKVNIGDIKRQFAGLDYRFYVIDKLNLLCAPASRLEQGNVIVNAEEV